MLRANRIVRYYDSHYRDDEELTQTFLHQAAIEYLIDLLKWFYYEQVVGMATNVNFYVTADPMEPGISPDVAVVEGLRIADRGSDEPGSYYVREDGPPPLVVFEISSDHTWRVDLGVDSKVPVEEQKPARYAAMGVKEYFVFDPQTPTIWTRSWKAEGRLVGWRLNEAGEYERIQKQADRLWSEVLESWVVVDGHTLRLLTRDGERRLTEAEAEKYRANLEKLRADEQARQKQFLAQELNEQIQQAQQKAEAAQQKADEQARQLAELMEKLRSKGLDPEKL